MKTYKVYLTNGQVLEVKADKQIGRGKWIYMSIKGVTVVVLNADQVAAILTVLPE